MSKKIKKLGSLVLTAIICVSTIAGNAHMTATATATALAENTNLNPEKDAMIFATEPLNGNFNPFYATVESDKNIVSQTQINMLSFDENGTLIAGDDQPTVVKDFEYEVKETGDGAQTVYTFVLKNDLKFSDGKPLTMEDVLFNMYEYLDPVYTGSSTMYSIDIVGLAEYRTQTNSSDMDYVSENLAKQAAAFARIRILELVYLFQDNGLIEGTQNSYSLSEAEMRAAIDNYEYVSEGYINAVASKEEQKTLTIADYRAQLKADYELTLKTFKEELESDFRAAKNAYDLTTMPYSEWSEQLSDDLFKFFLYEGYIQPVYGKMPNTSREDKTKIVKFEGTEVLNNIKTKEEAINRVYNDIIKYNFHAILQYWGTSGTLMNLYTAEAIDVLMRNTVGTGGLKYKNISGIQSLGHTTYKTEVTVNNKKYTVAHEYNADGTTKYDNEYEVLQITVNGVNPQAIYSFNFPVAPAHYYTADEQYPNGRPIDIANNQFGVEFASSAFQRNVIQSKQHEIPVGAGVYKAIESESAEVPTGTEFYHDGVVYFQRNEYFHTVGSGLNNAKIKYMQYKEIPSHQVLDALENGDIHFGEPPLTKAIINQASQMDMVGKATYWHNGYSYIGINAGKVPNVHIRRAIMSAMQTELALEYYEQGTCEPISWPISKVSWAYPESYNGYDYTQWTGVENALQKIKKYMAVEGVSPGDSALKITFTIAGTSITEHPTYEVFKQAAELLNKCGWDVEVQADSQALAKLATGSLQVWAADCESSLDPDMYNRYHKNSTATSVYSWGYREIKANTTLYRYEWEIINKKLSPEIDYARSITDQALRAESYKKAMGYVLDLAVELPVYQRKDLILWNKQVIDSDTLNLACNSIVGLTDRLWEIDFLEETELPPDDSGSDDSNPPAEDENYPKFRWNEEINLWEVSYDDGETWITLEEKKDDSDTPAEDENYPKFRWNEEINLWEVSYDDGETWITLEEKKDDSNPPAEDENYPKFRWNKDMNLWEVSYDNGETWIALEEKKDDSALNEPSAESGCGSIIVGGELSVLLVLGGALLLKKQKWE